MSYAELWVDADALEIPPSAVDRVWTTEDLRPDGSKSRPKTHEESLYPRSLTRLTPRLGRLVGGKLTYTDGRRDCHWTGPLRARSEFWGLTRPISAEEIARWDIPSRGVNWSHTTGFVPVAHAGDWAFTTSRLVPVPAGTRTDPSTRVYRGFPPEDLIDLFLFARGES